MRVVKIHAVVNDKDLKDLTDLDGNVKRERNQNLKEMNLELIEESTESLNFYLQNDDKSKEHPETLPGIKLIDNERNILVDVVSHPQLASESTNRAQQDENNHAPDDVDVHFLLQLTALVTRSTVV